MRASRSKSGYYAHALALLLTLTALVHTRSAEGQETTRLASVLIVTPSETNPLINEGVVRVRGELSALGLGTETQIEGKGAAPGPASANQGRLVFERFGDWLRIQAWDPSLDPPVTQWVDTSDPSVNAEVLAVRAVEALRAALLPYLLRRAPDSKSTTPTAPNAGTSAPSPKGPGGVPSTKPPAGTPSKGTAKKEPPLEKAPFTTRPLEEAPDFEEVEEEPTDPAKPHQKPKRPGGGVWLGPAVGFDLSADVINYGAQAGFNYGGSWLLLGARFEITQATLPVSAGRIEIRRFGVMADVRARFALLERLDAYAALGGGVQLHRIEGVPSRESYEGATAGHTSLAFLAEVGGLHWFASRFALYLSARSLVSTNAPAATVNSRSAGTLNRPELAFSAGLVLGFN